MLGFLLKLINPLGRILDTIDRKVSEDTERERIKADIVKTYASAQVALLNGPASRLLAIFIYPLGFWFASICLYSVFWCHDCAFPQTWTIAALPAPLDEWAGIIIASLFGGGMALQGYMVHTAMRRK